MTSVTTHIVPALRLFDLSLAQHVWDLDGPKESFGEPS